MRRKFKDLSIFHKLNFSFGFVILLMITLSFIDFSYYKSDKDTSTTAVVKQMDLQTISEIDSVLQSLSNLTKTPLFYSGTDALKDLDGSNTDPNEFLKVQNKFTNIFENIFSLNKDIYSVFAFNLNGDSYNKIKNSSLVKPYYVLNEPWFVKSIQNFEEPIIIPTYKLSNLGDGTLKSPYVFGVSRGLLRFEEGRVVGVIQINSKIEVLSGIVKKLLIYPGQRALIVNSNGYIIYDTLEKNIATSLIDSNFQDVLKKASYLDHKKIAGVASILSSETSNFSDWKIINIIPTNELNKNINILKARTYLVTFVFVLMSLFFVILLSRQILNPIKRMLKVMRIVEKGDFDVKVKVDSKDELGNLSSTFNTMTQRIKSLINEVYVDKINQKDIELQMLQSQINPHFIYNTLESIHMMAEINNDSETSKMATSFGSIIRYSLSRKNNVVRISEELKHLETYIELQRIRLDNIDEVLIQVDKPLYKYNVIKLILQPLVENAIYHGINTLEEGGKLKISGYIKDDSVIFDVIDNGTGMDKDKCDSLNGYINDLNEDFNSIGLRNVNQRIKLHYSDKYGVEILSSEGVGTIARITLPIIM